MLATSCASVFIRWAGAEGAPSLAIAAWRLLFASVVLVPYAALARRREFRSFSYREWMLIVASGVFLGLHFATWISSLAYTSVASSVVLVSMGPLFVALGSWLVLRERPSSRTTAGVVIAALGSAAIGWLDHGEGDSRLLGDVLALAGAVSVAGYLMIGRRVRATRSLPAYAAPVYAVAMVVLLATAAAARQPLLGYSARAYGWMLALGLVPQLLGHSTLNWALRHLTATHVAVVTLAEPIGATLLAVVLLGEAPSPGSLAAGLVILAGIYVAMRGADPQLRPGPG